MPMLVALRKREMNLLADKERFMDSCIPEPNSGCWLWLKSANPKYGVFVLTNKTLGKKYISAHRFSCEVFHGPSLGRNALHKCDNTLCVNPDHLYWGNQSKNYEDSVKRGKRFFKLSSFQIQEIRTSNEKDGILAVKFGVSRGLIRLVRKSNSWRGSDGSQ